MIFQDWITIVNESWISIWDRFVAFLPNLIGAAIVLIIGWIIGTIVALIIDRLFRIVGLQTLFEKAKVEESLKKADIDKDTTALLAAVAKWIILLVAFIAASNILRLSEVAGFLNSILAYIPNVVAAAAIMLIGLVLANFIGAVVKSGVKVGGLASADALSIIARYAIVIFASLAALVQLGIAAAMINTFFIGFVGLLAIAGGLAFGLGGQDAAKDWIDKVRKELK